MTQENSNRSNGNPNIPSHLRVADASTPNGTKVLWWGRPSLGSVEVAGHKRDALVLRVPKDEGFTLVEAPFRSLVIASSMVAKRLLEQTVQATSVVGIEEFVISNSQPWKGWGRVKRMEATLHVVNWADGTWSKETTEGLRVLPSASRIVSTPKAEPPAKPAIRNKVIFHKVTPNSVVRHAERGEGRVVGKDDKERKLMVVYRIALDPAAALNAKFKGEEVKTETEPVAETPEDLEFVRAGRIELTRKDEPTTKGPLDIEGVQIDCRWKTRQALVEMAQMSEEELAARADASRYGVEVRRTGKTEKNRAARRKADKDLAERSREQAAQKKLAAEAKAREDEARASVKGGGKKRYEGKK